MRNHFLRLKTRFMVDDPKRYPYANPIDWFVFFLTVFIGVSFVSYLVELDLLLHLVDQYSHLSIGRQITDSLTPGMSQVGFWPPLLHILLAPFTFFDGLYYTGYAAAALLLPLLALGISFFARSIYVLTDSRVIGYLAGLALLLNPYILYYSVTPMMEILFLSMLFGVLYYFVHWWRYQTLASLVWLGLLVSLASMSRFEGFILLPVVGLLILGRLLYERKRFSEIEAVATIFGLIASTGLAFIIIYGLVYGENALTFMNNSWSAYAQQRDTVLPAEHDWGNAFLYIGSASVEVLGEALLIVSLLLFVPLIVLAGRKRYIYLASLTILAAPFLFDILALYQGSAVIYLPSLPPYPEKYFNVRYGIFLIGVLIMIPALLAAMVWRYLYIPHRTFPFHVIPAFFIMALLLSSVYGYSNQVACRDCFDIIRNSIQVSSDSQRQAAAALNESYDGGYILMTRALNNEVAVKSEIPLKQFIMEANDYYYDQALAKPWWYARYVVMYNLNEDSYRPWMLENEQVSKNWARSDIFHYFYEEIFLTDTDSVYRLRENTLRDQVVGAGVDPGLIPSLNSNAEWDVEVTHQMLESVFAEDEASPPDQVTADI